MITEKLNSRRKIDRRKNYVQKETLDLLYRRYVVARIYVVLSMLTTILIAFLEPDSIYFHQFMQSSDESRFVLYMISIIIGFGVVDLFVNDLLPNKYKIIILYNNRHLIYMAMSLGVYGMTAAIILTDHSSVVIIRLWLDGFIAAVVAVLDIFARHGKRQDKGILWQSGK